MADILQIISEMHFLHFLHILYKISLKFVHKGSIKNNLALVQVKAWW